MKIEDTITPRITQDGLDVNIDRNEFALALKTYRLRNNYTQEALGKMWGCSRYTILRAERAKPITWEAAYRLFARLAAALRAEEASHVL